MRCGRHGCLLRSAGSAFNFCVLVGFRSCGAACACSAYDAAAFDCLQLNAWACVMAQMDPIEFHGLVDEVHAAAMLVMTSWLTSEPCQDSSCSMLAQPLPLRRRCMLMRNRCRLDSIDGESDGLKLHCLIVVAFRHNCWRLHAGQLCGRLSSGQGALTPVASVHTAVSIRLRDRQCRVANTMQRLHVRTRLTTIAFADERGLATSLSAQAGPCLFLARVYKHAGQSPNTSCRVNAADKTPPKELALPQASGGSCQV